MLIQTGSTGIAKQGYLVTYCQYAWVHIEDLIVSFLPLFKKKKKKKLYRRVKNPFMQQKTDFLFIPCTQTFL